MFELELGLWLRVKIRIWVRGRVTVGLVLGLLLESGLRLVLGFMIRVRVWFGVRIAVTVRRKINVLI